MKLLLIWLGNPVEYWAPLTGIVAIAVAAYLLYGIIDLKRALAGEKQPMSFMKLVKSFPGRVSLLVFGLLMILISGIFQK